MSQIGDNPGKSAENLWMNYRLQKAQIAKPSMDYDIPKIDDHLVQSILAWVLEKELLGLVPSKDDIKQLASDVSKVYTDEQLKQSIMPITLTERLKSYQVKLFVNDLFALLSEDAVNEIKETMTGKPMSYEDLKNLLKLDMYEAEPSVEALSNP